MTEINEEAFYVEFTQKIELLSPQRESTRFFIYLILSSPHSFYQTNNKWKRKLKIIFDTDS